MMYIFEGIDGSGKDTIIKLVQDFIHIPVFNGFNVYDKSEFPEVHKYVNDKEEWQKAITFEIINFCRQTNTDVIINRFIWSEMVYSYILRGKVDTKYWSFIENELKGMAKIIYVDVAPEEALKRLKKTGRKKSKEVLQNLELLREEYINSYLFTPLPTVRINSMASYGGKNYLNDKHFANHLAVDILTKTGDIYGYTKTL